MQWDMIIQTWMVGAGLGFIIGYLLGTIGRGPPDEPTN